MLFNFPHIYRKIPAGILKAVDYATSLLLFVLITINFSLFSINKNTEEKKLIIAENANILGIEVQKPKTLEEINYWKSISSTFPDYRYANLKLSNLYQKMGENKKANEFLEKYRAESMLTLIP